MASPFFMSIFYELIFDTKNSIDPPSQLLGGYSGSSFLPETQIEELPIVVFDFETTGLETKSARIIEIGGIKYFKRKEIARFSTFVKPPFPIGEEITGITGITNDMLKDAPRIDEALPDFHDFLRGCVGIAHNAEFDLNMLHYESLRIGMMIDYTILCTLKMSRELIKDIDRRNLDSLAQYFGLNFESRHRSIGDILVTAEVFFRLLARTNSANTVKSLQNFRQYLETNK